ncbi:MAG: ATP-binding cassette domain-containing protein, partial [Hyphomonadaceae bacterium]|nr:ATP-binding cassette domain-containing protein [Hyphomonadaceae bacterium]
MSPEGTARRSAQPEASTGGLGAVRIAKAYRGRQVVKDVSLFLRRGEVVGLLGPNGAGKTTCFYMITGL